MKDTVKAINTIAKFLAKRDIPVLNSVTLQEVYGVEKIDLFALIGNCVPDITMKAGKLYRDNIADRLLIAGGDGHTTPFLRSAVHERYPDIPTEGRPEADIMTDLLEKVYEIRSDEIAADNKSLNCGQNARNALRVAKKEQMNPKTVLLMQDPTMQQRIDASFRKEWRSEKVIFINYAPFVPQVNIVDDELVFTDPNIWGIWSMDHFISLILGEIPRLNDDVNGYGPMGQGFIAHVDIPQEVMEAHTYLKKEYEALVRA